MHSLRRLILILALLVSAFFLMNNEVSAAAAAARDIHAPAKVKSKLEQQVKAWSDTLSKQQGFGAWKNATPVIVPIGPGTHGWLVTFQVNHQPVGYMIVNATANGGFALGEYGAGNHPAFDPNTLYRSLIRQGLITSFAEATKKPLHLERLYLSPVLAVWKWTTATSGTYYLDAWTAEALPINNKMWDEQSAAVSAKLKQQAQTLSAVSGARANVCFDPYERMPWLTKSPLSYDQVRLHLPEYLDQMSQIRYTAELYRQTVLFVFPAIGYHRWNSSSIFVEVDYEGSRYIPMATMNDLGHFYR
ncbi:hypothetical protein [Paenibacillus sp. OV219]|uniref:hypothetical protein n=1 Tax=Paenibacillus sp. OV219 TaxID=1884377 RepID=UPI0008B0883B|nr:hypothetical protein [Paenibacillus sp. OV219]SEM72874.1 hypothetical protein SAMN05518847_101634 [Paenibacillus sp. OV219]